MGLSGLVWDADPGALPWSAPDGAELAVHAGLDHHPNTRPTTRETP